MSWFNVWDGLKNKICRYLLQRYLGKFLEEQLNLEQLKVELFNGRATIKNVSLKVEAINELFEDQGWPFEVSSGHIGELTVVVPWNALMTSDSSIEVNDLNITFRPIKRYYDGTSMVESMWSSASSSMQLAEECMKQTEGDNDIESHTNVIAGLEKFAETIDNVLNRITAKFTNTLLRLEYSRSDETSGLGINLNILSIYYKNETGSAKNLHLENLSNTTQQNIENEFASEHIQLLPMFAKHNITILGVKISTEEFIIPKRKSSMSMFTNSTSESKFSINTIIELRNEQKIQMKIKQTEDVRGPKMMLDVELGSIFTFITPRQIHVILKLLTAFNDDKSGDPKKTKDFNCQKNCTSKAHHCIYKYPMSGNLNHQGNWVDDFKEQFSKCDNVYSLKGTNIANTNLYNDSLSTSISSVSTASSSRVQRKTTSMDSCSEILNFNIRIASIVGVILQEDILITSNMNEDYDLFNEKSQADMHLAADNFFSNINDNIIEGYLEQCLCKKNHIFFQLLPIFAEGIQQRNKITLLENLKISIAKFNLYEVLESKATPLILFEKTKNFSELYHTNPDIEIDLSSSLSYNMKQTVTTFINLKLKNCTMEVDISIYDRLSYVFGSSNFTNTAAFNKLDEPKINKNNAIDSNFEVNIVSSSINLKLRFPISDARPIDDPERVPWWKQNIRTDFLLLTLSQMRLKFRENLINITANELNVYYCEKDIESKIHLLQSTLIKSSHQMDTESLTCPNIIINMVPTENITAMRSDSGLEKHKKSLHTEGYVHNAPFSSKRSCRQSDTRHSKRDKTETETILLPGDPQEINNFRVSAMKTSKLQIKINLPIVHVLFKSKELYELIYNRLNTDLLMWEPSSSVNSSELNENKMDSLNIPMSKVQYESITNYDEDISSESENSDKYNPFESIYFSFNENAKTSHIQEKKIESSKCAIDILVKEGTLVFLLPVRDSNKCVLSEQNGKMEIKIENLQIFSVNGYNNNSQLTHLCIQLKNFYIFHCGTIPDDSLINILNSEETRKYMKSTFYKIPKGLTKILTLNSDETDMLSFVIEIKRLQKERVKRLKITAGIQKTVLRFHPSIVSNIWLNQLMDFLDVVDYPVAGYQPFGIITEIQLHLWNCVIDYRPKYMPYRATFEIGTFMISSNIISSISGCNLRFIFEECALCLAPYELTNPFPDYEITFISSKNLVPVLDIGVLDISLRIDENPIDKCSIFDMRCSIHEVHLRTCSDSGIALAQLIAYLANDGDFDNNNENKINAFPQLSESETNLSSTNDSHVQNITPEQQARVNLMMAEAIKESSIIPSRKQYKDIPMEKPDEIYFFPDESDKGLNKSISDCNYEHKAELFEILNFESKVMSNSYYHETCPQNKTELNDIDRNYKIIDFQNKNSEDDFCIISDDGTQISQQYGIKNIKTSEEPIIIVDNHFCLPVEKTDLLKTPENFPTAVVRYTLCEMTLTWHLYGGSDFQKNTTVDEQQSKNEKSNMSEVYQKGVSYSKSTRDVIIGKKVKEKPNLKTKGGIFRNHEVLVEMQFSKVRFSHEEYPMHKLQASRQVLLISDIEIRDRLQSSDINKLLYHANKSNISNRSAQYMVIVKALHVRPNPQLSSSKECSLRVSVLPLRLHIDQETLVFLLNFFSKFGDNTISNENEINSQKNNTVQQMQPPVMAVDHLPEVDEINEMKTEVTANLNDPIQQEVVSDNNISIQNENVSTTEKSTPIYFREIIFSPDVKICLDYHGRHVELSRGPFAGVLMGLAQLQSSELCLRKIVYRRGILGFDKLVSFMCKEWLKDIKRNQLPKILSGVGPTYALVQLFQGIYDLFWIPIEQYQKDRRLMKGFQLGAQSFTARTALAALEITSRIIQLLQFTAETAFDMVSPGPSVKRCRKKKEKKKRHQRPKDIREGVTNAYLIVKEGINDSATILIETAVAEHDQKGYTGAVGAVMRQIPQLVVCPAVLATQATTNILGGVKSSLVPEAKLEAREKWKNDAD
ncbi:autophagy-related protein 2 homolog B isoform X2 [Teleopsis dalmanni]|uniref:autophagy-related protein 2 homolog B isoform X2 n=1 Tax=Teleopsis dalmanni TaxID=139649 RepID=UPI0018CC823A|nr:autophagy-related protein 2 homolog B isoform X2 [Teleopsis dalmanni]